MLWTKHVIFCLVLLPRGKGGEGGVFPSQNYFLYPLREAPMNEVYHSPNTSALRHFALLLPFCFFLLAKLGSKGWVCTMYVWNVGILGGNESLFLLRAHGARYMSMYAWLYVVCCCTCTCSSVTHLVHVWIQTTRTIHTTRMGELGLGLGLGQVSNLRNGQQMHIQVDTRSLMLENVFG